MYKLERYSEERQDMRWNVTKDGEVVSTHATIREAMQVKFELERNAPKVKGQRSRERAALKMEQASRGKHGGHGLGNRYSGR